MDDVQPFTWTFPYVRERAASGVSGQYILRPVVPIRFPDHDGIVQTYEALVDSGAANVLAAGWLAMHLGVTPAGRQQLIRIGGASRSVVFEDVDLELQSPDGTTSVPWRTEVGFMDWTDPPWLLILGQSGFFDRFTVCLSRLSQAVSVHHRDHFDETYQAGRP